MNKIAYYNDSDPFVCEWTRNLILDGLIFPGEVDERPIQEVQPKDLEWFKQVHFFSGINGWSHALRLAGWPPGRGVWTGSAPCQPFSCAGKGEGVNDERHLWPEMFRLIRECRPPVILGEQVGSKDGLAWLDGVHADLDSQNYAFGVVDLPAACQGAPHIRQRLFWVAISLADSNGWQSGNGAAQRSGQHRLLQEGRMAVGLGQPDSEGLPLSQCGEPGGSAGTDGRSTEQSGGSSGGVGNADLPRREEAVRRQGINQRDIVEPGCGFVVGGMDNATGQRTSDGGQAEQGGDGTHNGVSGQAGVAIVGVGHPDNSRGGQAGAQLQGRDQASTPWSDYLLIGCRDEKVRRVSAEPSDVPLAHGIPSRKKDPRMGYLISRLGQLGHSPKSARGVVGAARRNRVGRLRGYGNAIVPAVAVEFIRVVMEWLGIQQINGEQAW